MNIPNSLTWLRIALIPILVVMFYLPMRWAHIVTAAIFLIASITDWLDGFLARHLHQTSRLGAFLDPVADKLIIVTALLLIVAESNFPFLAIPTAVIVGREIVISALREWMAEVGKRTSVAVSFIGKVKTFIQMLAIFLLLLGRPDSGYPMIGLAGYIMLYIATALTLWSMCYYLKSAWSELTA